MVEKGDEQSRIAFFHQNEVDNSQGGVERYVSTLLKSSGSDAVLVTERNGNEGHDNRITLDLLGPTFLPKSLRFNLAVLANVRRIRNELQARGVGVLELSRPEYALVSWLFSQRQVFTFHGMGPNGSIAGRRFIHDLATCAMAWLAHTIQIVGRDDSALPSLIRRRARPRIVHLDAWYDDRFRCTPLPPLKDETLTLFYSGRISEDKNPELLFAVMRQSIKNLPFRVKIRYFGSDNVKIKAAGLENIVECSGYLEPSRLAAEIAKCHVGLLCSPQEGSPFAMIETLACGRAFVSSPIAGLIKTYADKPGVFFAQSMTPSAFLYAIAEARDFLMRDGAGVSAAHAIADAVRNRSQSDVARSIIARLKEAATDTAAAAEENDVVRAGRL